MCSRGLHTLIDQGKDQEVEGSPVNEIIASITVFNKGGSGEAELSNEISAPYEFPKFPIEQIENKLAKQRMLRSKAVLDRGTILEQGSSDDVDIFSDGDWKNGYLYNTYQRVSISGEDTSGVSIEDRRMASGRLVEALQIRYKYMKMSRQSFPALTAKFILNMKSEMFENLKDVIEGDAIADHCVHAPSNGNPWDCEIPPPSNYVIKPVEGVFQVYKNREKADLDEPLDYPYPHFLEFVAELNMLCSTMVDGPLKSFCYRRLTYLSSKYQLHLLLNELRELASQKAVPHRDFYNIRKVDTHIHAASCMNQKHLLRFIKKTLKNHKDEVVTKTDKGSMTLEEVFRSMNLTSYDLTVDMLDVHADRNTFHRFDKFNSKYNPIGESRLREVFLKTDNYLNGKYFARIIKEVSADLEESKYQNSELRLSIYGKNVEEWDKLANWAIENDVYSDNVRWLIQIPRLFDIFKLNNLMSNFQEFLTNIFLPLFEVTNDPSSHPNLHRFLQYVVGFDSVDDESKPENPMIDKDTVRPEEWTQEENPPYAYYQYYMFANMAVLNHFREEKGMNTFVHRPHCGEAGPVQHLVCGFMMAENISHGLLLRKVPVLQYLYYLARIGIAMSPLSNNSLFLNYHR